MSEENFWKAVIPAKTGIQVFILILFLSPLIYAAPQVEWISKVVGSIDLVYPGPSRQPRLSDDGRYVVFETVKNLVVEDDNRSSDVYRLDRQTGELKLISKEFSGWVNTQPSMSGSGQHIVFQAQRPASIKDFAERFAHIRFWQQGDLYAQPLMPDVEIPQKGGEDHFPQISWDGSTVTFTSNSLFYTSSPPDPIRQVYLYDRTNKQLELVSHSTFSTYANRPCVQLKMSTDVSKVYFLSSATNLDIRVPKSSLTTFIYQLDRSSGTINRIDFSKNGFPSTDFFTINFEIDGSGQKVLIETRKRIKAPVTQSLDAQDIFLWDDVSKKLKRLSTGIWAGRSSAGFISGNGRFVGFIFQKKGQKNDRTLVLIDLSTGKSKEVLTAQISEIQFSSDGQWFTFVSRNTFDTGSKAGEPNIFVLRNPFLIIPVKK
ncbi:MAG: hypothetical protein ACKVQC_08705 [Elusimicrobiota bacterium]